MDPLADLMRATAARLGISPIDLATVMSFETGGTFDPRQSGPTTRWGHHMGLIQMGEPQRAQYGYDPNGPLSGQFDAVGRYLTDAGVQPGMGLLDLESAVNAGHVGRYNASDAAAGGTTGTVRDKVQNQMGGHVLNAERLLESTAPQTTAPPMPLQTQSQAPATPSAFEMAMQMPVQRMQEQMAPQPAELPPVEQPQPIVPPMDFSPRKRVSDYRAPDLNLLSTSVRPLKL